MHAQHHHLILRHKRQVLTEPLQLRVEEARLIRCGGSRCVDNVAHTYDMHITTIERVVHRAEDSLVVALYLELECRTCLIGIDNRRGRAVEVSIVVTHNLEHRHTNLRYGKSVAHIVTILLIVVGRTVRDDVTKRNAVARHTCIGNLGDILLGVRHCRILETPQARRVRHLRIGKREECKSRLLATLQRCECKVVLWRC